MAAKTRRNARKGRSTRRSTRGAKRGGFFGMCSSRGPKRCEHSRKDIMDYLTKRGWSVRYDPGMDIFPLASCGKIAHQIVGDDDRDGSFWSVPTNTCDNGKISPKTIDFVKMGATQHAYTGLGLN